MTHSMTTAPVIQSLIDDDLYKFTMQQVVLHRFPSAHVRYKFKCRNPGIPLGTLHQQVRDEIDHLCTLTFTQDELDFLGQLRFIKKSYTDFLKGFRLNPQLVHIEPLSDGSLDITVEGSWFHTILFEVKILAIVNELYFRQFDTDAVRQEGQARLDAKSKLLSDYTSTHSNFFFSDFGTRRRFSRDWQYHVVKTLRERHPDAMTGTSNLYLAKELNLTPIGTMAHEYLQAFQVLGGNLQHFQKDAFEAWAQEYRGDLGIALSDVVGMDAFLKEFDLYFCKLFDGARHDSGDPFVWAHKLIEHYQKNRIDPKTKTFTFSNNLTIASSIELHQAFADQTRPFFGIGTHLTNDLGIPALNIVMKMVSCNGQPVAKLSDDRGKMMCEDDHYVQHLARTFGVDVL